jgi:hypothetical protein
MSPKFLKSRWFESQEASSALGRIKQILNSGGILKKEHTPFGVIENSLSDFRGLDLNGLKIKGFKTENSDFSNSNFNNSWIEKSTFINVKFDRVDFTEISDSGNLFNKATFFNCNFNKAGIGYEGSQYLNCIFDNSIFTKAVFIRSEFNNSQFINCKLKGVDFNASSFEKCIFIGKLDAVWFRGGYSLSSDIKEFGKAKKNQMLDVSFEKAILEGVNFSNECDLSRVTPPVTGNYQIFNDWKDRLEYLKTKIADWPVSQKKEAEIFANSYLVHAKTQDWFLINIEEIQQEFGIDVATNIIITLNKM